jgi:hypothetical protein
MKWPLYKDRKKSIANKILTFLEKKKWIYTRWVDAELNDPKFHAFYVKEINDQFPKYSLQDIVAALILLKSNGHIIMTDIPNFTLGNINVPNSAGAQVQMLWEGYIALKEKYYVLELWKDWARRLTYLIAFFTLIGFAITIEQYLWSRYKQDKAAQRYIEWKKNNLLPDSSR